MRLGGAHSPRRQEAATQDRNDKNALVASALATVKPVFGAIVLAGVLAVVAAGQTSVPTVAVSAGGSSITLQPATSIAAGPTRFTVTRRGRRRRRGGPGHPAAPA